jgi:hypothetical protein
MMKLWTFTPELWRADKPKVKQYVAKVTPGQPLAEFYDRVVVLGDYSAPSGGMDTVSDKNDRYAMTAVYASKNFKRTLVLAEGLLYGGVYGVTEGLGVLSEQRSSGLWTYAFMNTPIEVCLDRVKARRAARGVTAPMNPKNTTDKHRCIAGVEARVRAGDKPNHLVHVVDYKLPPARAARALCKALEAYEAGH